jgi:hypothetical protein
LIDKKKDKKEVTYVCWYMDLSWNIILHESSI